MRAVYTLQQSKVLFSYPKRGETMASKAIKGITVEIGGDTVGLQKALNEADKSSKILNSE